MAFEWKWQPTLDEELSLRAKAAMDGYRPLSNPSNTYGMVYGNGAGPSVAQVASNGMSGYASPAGSMVGYVPSRAPDTVPQPAAVEQNFGQGGEGAIERGQMSGANNYGQGMAYTQNIQALQEEYLRNAYRIAELEQQIANKKNEISAGIKSRNELDMQLAANRARIGDMGNSLAHQQAINTREYQQYLRDLEKSKEGQSKESQLERDVIDAYTELAWADNEKQQQVAQFKVDKALEAYKKATGKDYANPFAVDTGSAKPGQKANTLEKAWAKYTASFDKNGNPTQAAIDEWNKDKQGLPFSAELQEKDNQVSKATSQEKAKNDAGKLAKKQQDAVDEIAANIDSYKLNKNNGSYTETATNGQSVTVTKNSNGKAATVRCGKKSKVVDL